MIASVVPQRRFPPEAPAIERLPFEACAEEYATAPDTEFTSVSLKAKTSTSPSVEKLARSLIYALASSTI